MTTAQIRLIEDLHALKMMSSLSRSRNALDEAIATVHELAKLQAREEWVAIADRPPSCSGSYLVTIGNAYVSATDQPLPEGMTGSWVEQAVYLMADNGHDYGRWVCRQTMGGEVTRWRELPKPPKSIEGTS